MSSHIEINSARIFALAVPAALANITTPLLGVVATTVIGRLGDAAILGGVAMAALVFDCMFWLFGFLRSGTVALTAQAYGMRDPAEQRAVLARAMLTAALVGGVLIAARLPLTDFIFRLMGGSADVSATAREYFLVRTWSSPFALANYVMIGWFVGLARPLKALSIQITVNIINMALTVIAVLWLGWGASGAALSAVFAEACGLAMGLTMAWRMLEGRLEWRSRAHFDRDKLWRVLLINRDIMLRTAALITVFLVFSSQSARAGDVTLAANAVLQNLVMAGAFLLEGIASAAQQLCGATYGARDRAGFFRAVRLLLRWAAGFGIAVAALFYLGGGPAIDMMTANEEVRRVAHAYLPLAALVPAMGALGFCLDGIYIGATWTRDIRNMMTVAMTIYLATWWATASLGNTGLWIAMLTFYFFRSALLGLRGRWLFQAEWPPR